jgi:hypothetical protein
VDYFIKVVLATLVVTIVTACSCKENTIDEVNAPEVTVSWNSPKTLVNGQQIPDGHEIRYQLYIDLDDDKKHLSKTLLTDEPIRETTYKLLKIEEIRMKYGLKEGHYYLGLQAILFKDGKPVQPRNQSEIIWSNSAVDTGNKPFGVDINECK